MDLDQVDVLAEYPVAARLSVCSTLTEAMHAKLEAGTLALASITQSPAHVAFALSIVNAAFALPFARARAARAVARKKQTPGTRPAGALGRRQSRRPRAEADAEPPGRRDAARRRGAPRALPADDDLPRERAADRRPVRHVVARGRRARRDLSGIAASFSEGRAHVAHTKTKC